MDSPDFSSELLCEYNDGILATYLGTLGKSMQQFNSTIQDFNVSMTYNESAKSMSVGGGFLDAIGMVGGAAHHPRKGARSGMGHASHRYRG